MPAMAPKWISTAKNIVRSQFLRCLQNTTPPTFRDGNVYNKRSRRPTNGVVCSNILGEYNVVSAKEVKDVRVTVDRLIETL